MTTVMKGNEDMLLANAKAYAAKGRAACTSEPEAPDLIRIANNIDFIIKTLADSVLSLDASLERFGRPRLLDESASCGPLRCGSIGSIEDKLDRLSALVSDAREIASQLNRIA